ncbi:MAG TPA: hypothetical protein PKB14_24990 [Rubrivivax sp.]|nr:hypothetical protein [Rubrivivax sp.]
MHALRLSGGLAAVLFTGLAWVLAPLEPGVLALQFAFTPRAFASIVHVWPPEHLALYRAHLPVDFLLLAAYGSFGWLLASRTTLFAGLRASLRRVAAWVLPLAASFDAVENGLHWWLTAAPRFGLPALYALAAAAAALKWLLLLLFGALVVHAMLGEAAH